MQVYGFDYDYTLACYKPELDYLLYNLGRDMLIKKYKVSWKSDGKFFLVTCLINLANWHKFSEK